MGVIAAPLDPIAEVILGNSGVISGQRLLTRPLLDLSHGLERRSEPARILYPGVPPARRDNPGPGRSHLVANSLLVRGTNSQRGGL
jgi:hypothetical protein